MYSHQTLDFVMSSRPFELVIKLTFVVFRYRINPTLQTKFKALISFKPP